MAGYQFKLRSKNVKSRGRSGLLRVTNRSKSSHKAGRLPLSATLNEHGRIELLIKTVEHEVVISVGKRYQINNYLKYQQKLKSEIENQDIKKLEDKNQELIESIIEGEDT